LELKAPRLIGLRLDRGIPVLAWRASSTQPYKELTFTSATGSQKGGGGIRRATQNSPDVLDLL
jgi:hypothetical protein